MTRPPGLNRAGVVFGVVSTPTRKHPEGMRRVLIAGDATRDMGALTADECDRIVAALDLAERERLPVEWVAVSAGARIAMDSGTENLDATARVVRRLVTFTDAGGEVNLVLPGINVGAQSYFDALATMEMRSRGILIMLANASMVLTGRAALEFSGGVAAEDEIGDRRVRANHGAERRGVTPGARPRRRLFDPARALRVQLRRTGRDGPAAARHRPIRSIATSRSRPTRATRASRPSGRSSRPRRIPGASARSRCDR